MPLNPKHQRRQVNPGPRGCNKSCLRISLTDHGREGRHTFDFFPSSAPLKNRFRSASLPHLSPLLLILFRVGHSLGAGISVVVAAALPNKVQKLILLEGLGSSETPGTGLSPSPLQSNSPPGPPTPSRSAERARTD